MEKESSEIHPGDKISKNPVKTSLFNFDIPGKIVNMKQSQACKDGVFNAMSFYNKPEKKCVISAFHKETKFYSYQANDTITYHVMDGKSEFHAAKESVMLKEGHLLTLHEKIRYSLKSREETVYLLTVPDEFQNTLNDHYA